MEKAGYITDLRRQVLFELVPASMEKPTVGPRGGVRPGKVIENPVNYIADFVYYKGGERIVEDVKGVHTADYIIKRKLMLYIHGIRISET